MKNVLTIHGPNLNMLGKREPTIYGHLTLENINQLMLDKSKQLNCHLEFFQSNAEHQIIEAIHAAMNQFDYIIINPAAYTHTSVAIRDALLAVNIPFVEVHLSNVHARESFRHHSYFSDVAKAVVCGFGALGYTYALDFIANQ